MKKTIIGLSAIVALTGSVMAANNIGVSVQAGSVQILTDTKGMSLYTFDKDTAGISNCYDGCEVKWPVYHADLTTLPKEVKGKDFSTITRKNGAMQTTYKGKPLYYFFKDTKPNQTNGNGAKGVWHLVEIAK